MSERQAIRLEGMGAESTFLELVPNSRTSDNAKLGDVIVEIDGESHYVEIKECHAEPGRQGTINQIRPIKFIPCVIYLPNRGCWYVFSAEQLVRIASTRDRGQHTELAMECMHLSLNSIPDVFYTHAANDKLADAVRQAIEQGSKAGGLRELMQSLFSDIMGIKTKYAKAVLLCDKGST